jgi:pyruvate dehydrogenase E1 component alpha subunit
MDVAHLYRQMARSRAFEVAVAELWNRGLIAGEMHLGTGEEAVAAGVVTHLREGDGLALTHRCTPALVVRGVPLVPMLRELLGREDGLCAGRGGHMHLFSRAHLVATSGIVGASLPTAAGFALANRRLRPGAVAVAFTGTGAMNQGMALETLNLCVAWGLPLVIVCIDNGWAITTTSEAATGGDLVERASAFGLQAERVDGTDVAAVHAAAGNLVDRARSGHGPSFLLATCPRLDGHFLGDPLLRMATKPVSEGRATFGKVMASAVSRGGGSLGDRAGGMGRMMAVLATARRGARRDGERDPLVIARSSIAGIGLDVEKIEAEVDEEIGAVVGAALADERGGAGA